MSLKLLKSQHDFDTLNPELRCLLLFFLVANLNLYVCILKFEVTEKICRHKNIYVFKNMETGEKMKKQIIKRICELKRCYT